MHEHVIQQAWEDGHSLMHAFSDIRIDQMGSIRGEVSGEYFLGQVTLEGTPTEVMGSVQRTRITYDPAKFSHPREFRQRFFDLVGSLTPQGRGLAFSEIKQRGHPSEVEDLGITAYKMDILSFFEPSAGKGWLNRFLWKVLPMSAYVIFSPAFDRPLKSHSSNGAESYSLCYSFPRIRSGSPLFGFGPGKFDRAIKHFHLHAIDLARNSFELTATALISPRSKKVLNLFGFDPVYSFFRGLDLLTFKRFSLFARVRKMAEMAMMKHHVKVHNALIEMIRDQVS